MNFTNELPTNLPNEWIPTAPIPQRDEELRHYNSMHLDRPDAEVDVQFLGGRKNPRRRTVPALSVDQTTEFGVEEQLRIFFSATDPEVQLSLADALEDIAEQLRDNASATFATFLAEERRVEQLNAYLERANDASGFDNGVELTA